MVKIPPFDRDKQLCADLDLFDDMKPFSLPGIPWLDLQKPDQCRDFLYTDLVSDELEAAAPRLWIMTTQSSANIHALHGQIVNGRRIEITEDPKLHLVWSHDRMLIKPLPRYLLSHTFWTLFLSDKATKLGSSTTTERIRRSALGFMRTYRYLIKHESDFSIATRNDARLLPLDISWPQYCHFISEFANVLDADVCPRYCYGELRLSRLNFYACLLFQKFSFQRTHWEYSDYFGRFFGPVLFAFAIITTVLNGMQVALAVEQVQPTNWKGFGETCRWFAIVSIIIVAVVFVTLSLAWLWVIGDEWVYALKDRWRKRDTLAKRTPGTSATV